MSSSLVSLVALHSLGAQAACMQCEPLGANPRTHANARNSLYINDAYF